MNTTCRECKTPIVFLITRSGASMPVDASSVQEGDTMYDHTRHVSHFGTCPKADKFRKKKPPTQGGVE